MRKVILSILLSLCSFQSLTAAPLTLWERAYRNLFRITYEEHVGTGFCKPDGGAVIITAAHMVDFPNVTVAGTLDKQPHPTTRMAFDKKTDIATLLLKDKACELSSLQWGPTPKPGDVVFLIGYGGGRGEPFLTTGIVSGLKGSIEEQPNGVPVQLNALGGHSGGPVFDAQGRVVGMMSGILTAGDHLDVMIPVEEIRKVAR
jgi:S1-C subfamily serine protease